MGYYLGIPDSSNICRESLDKTKSILKAIIDEIVLPSVLNTNGTSVLMAKNITDAIGMDYPMLVYKVLQRKFIFKMEVNCTEKLINCQKLGHGIILEELWIKFSLKQKFITYTVQVIFWLYSFQIMKTLLNKVFMILAMIYFVKTNNVVPKFRTY